jgi:hypothetical protein
MGDQKEKKIIFFAQYDTKYHAAQKITLNAIKQHVPRSEMARVWFSPKS